MIPGRPVVQAPTLRESDAAARPAGSHRAWLLALELTAPITKTPDRALPTVLAHCIDLVAPRHVIVAAELIAPFMTALPHLAGAATIWVHGTGHDDFPRVDLDVDRRAGEPLGRADRRPPTIEDRALYIYTSGTTGLPKAASVSHFRLMQWSHWFAGLMDVRGGDRMYDCLPMYHSVGGVVAPGAALV